MQSKVFNSLLTLALIVGALSTSVLAQPEGPGSGISEAVSAPSTQESTGVHREPTVKGEVASLRAPKKDPAATPAAILADILIEGFEDGVMPPPGGWSVINTHPTRNWTIVDAAINPDFVHSGDYAAWVNYDTPTASDEWLLTPQVDLTDVPDASLSFWAVSDTNWCPGGGSGANMLLHVTNTGGTPIATVWDMCGDESWPTFTYRQVTVDLSAYVDQTIRLAWQYVGIDGESFGLDDISLTGTQGNAGWLEGYVMDSETGDVDPTCTQAIVHVEPVGLDVPADPLSGRYGPLQLISGTYTLEASAPGFSLETAAVDITTDMTTTQDFNLWRPVIEVTPTDFISITAVISEPVIYTLTISNSGHLPLDFEIEELPPSPLLNTMSGVEHRPGVEVEPELLNQLNAGEATSYMVFFHEGPDLSPAFDMDWHERGWFVMNALQEAAERSQVRVRTYLDAQGAEYQAFWIENVIVVESSDRTAFNNLMSFPEIAALRTQRTMDVIEPVQKTTISNIAPMAIEANICHVQADQVWSLGYTGEGMVVANIDTGVRYTHDALVNQYRGNLGGGSFSHNYNWLDPDTGNTSPFDDHGHGSHTMGIMIGDDGGANQIGMAPNAQWMACDACNSSSGCPGAALLTCAQWVAAPYPIGDPSSPNPDLRPHVVNNSWGDCGRSYDNWYQAAVDAWHAAGIYPIFSNGNASNCYYPEPPGCNTVGNPARYGNVTGVGSTGRSDGQYATHSNWGPTDNPDTVNPRGYPNLKPQVMAPGVSIRSSLNLNDSYYASWGGTSMSAPHVAGLVALMWQAGPCLVGDYATTETLVEQTATPIPYATGCGGEGPGNVPNHATGWGEINALAAVEAAEDYCGGDWLPWVWQDPISGTIPGPGVIAIDVTFHCTETMDYIGSLRVVHDDPCAGFVDVPIVLHCQASPDNTPPTLSGLPDQVFDHSTSPPGTIDLWAYASDAETPDSGLTYALQGTPPAGAGVWLQGNQYVHVDPSPNWCGGTDVTVRATDPGGLWDEDAFRVAVSWSCPGPVGMPGAPVLIAPVDDSTAHSDTPTFAWHPVGGAEAYRVQVDEADEGHPADGGHPADERHPADFARAELDETLAGTEYVLAAELSDGTYTWRVRAVSGAEMGDWSPGWTFTVPATSPGGFTIYLPVVTRDYP